MKLWIDYRRLFLPDTVYINYHPTMLLTVVTLHAGFASTNGHSVLCGDREVECLTVELITLWK